MCDTNIANIPLVSLFFTQALLVFLQKYRLILFPGQSIEMLHDQVNILIRVDWVDSCMVPRLIGHILTPSGLQSNQHLLVALILTKPGLILYSRPEHFAIVKNGQI